MIQQRSSTPIRIGLFGTGRFGRSLADIIKTLPALQLYAVYDVVNTSAATLAREFDAHWCATPEELLSLPTVDAVIIASSHDTHAPLAIAAAKAGKHIFCEKPMALDVAECQAMIATAHEHNVKLLIGQVTRLLPIIQRVHQVLESGTIGRPVAMSVLRSGWFDRRGWWARASTSGGMLHSHGAHLYDLVGSILGRPAFVMAVAAPRVQLQVDYDDTIFSLVTYESGAVASVGASISGQTWVYQGDILGDTGTIQFSLGLSECWLEIHPRGWPESVREAFGTFEQESINGIKAELENFIDMLLVDSPPFVAPEVAMEAVAIIHSAYNSIRSGEKHPIGPVHEKDFP